MKNDDCTLEISVDGGKTGGRSILSRTWVAEWQVMQTVREWCEVEAGYGHGCNDQVDKALEKQIS